jgi:diadenosine tetraphosphate (Ap4A) HIT family hydrolase
MKTDANCIFCKIVAGQMSCFKLLEDDSTLAIMDIYPANDGHCLVLSKEHFPTVFDISDEAFAAVSHSVNRVAEGGEPGTMRRLRIFGQQDKLRADRSKGRETWA